MSAPTESGFEWPVPSSIKLDGFHCYRRGGCDRQSLCEGEGECLGVDPLLTNAPSGNPCDEIAEGECLAVGPPLPNTSRRNGLDEIAEMIRTLTYAEMLEFARGLWSLRGRGTVNVETLPQILYAWATETELGSDCAVQSEPALPAGGYDWGAGKKFQPIDTAPKDRPILAFMLGRWRIAQWRLDHPRKRPIPFWSANDLRVTVSRPHQPKWWAELPSSPPEAEA
jgi:hypothetical protein